MGRGVASVSALSLPLPHPSNRNPADARHHLFPSCIVPMVKRATLRRSAGEHLGSLRFRELANHSGGMHSHEGSRPGRSAAESAHRSASEFSMGVPLTTRSRHGGVQVAQRTPVGAAVRGFLTACASSMTTPSAPRASLIGFRRTSVAGGDHQVLRRRLRRPMLVPLRALRSRDSPHPRVGRIAPPVPSTQPTEVGQATEIGPVRGFRMSMAWW